MIYEGAQERLLSVNFRRGGCTPRLFIIHIMEGTLAGTDSWFRNPEAQVSAHFGAGRDGSLYQWVRTTDTAWHAAEANSYAIGCECEGDIEDGLSSLTAAQLETVAKAYAWAHQNYPAISLWVNQHPFTGSGLSWHGLGGQAWGGHLECPGTAIRGQLHEILAAAKASLA